MAKGQYFVTIEELGRRISMSVDPLTQEYDNEIALAIQHWRDNGYQVCETRDGLCINHCKKG